MSQPSRPRVRGPEQRRRRDYRFETVSRLEDRYLLAPFVTTFPLTATFTAATTPTNDNLGTVTIGPNPVAGYPTQEPVTTVAQLTPSSSFGGDIVRIKAGPGGDFGKGVYAISRGAGENAGAINRPGVIYRVDPATGKASVFFDLNTVVNQLTPPSASAANQVSVASGLVNWYDLSFDSEGYFDGRPSLFVTSVDRSDPNKNAIYRIAPDGTFLGMFVQFTQGQAAQQFKVNPTSVLVPPPEDQSFLRGLFAGSGISSTGGQFSALFFNANAYTPGQNINSTSLPAGVQTTNLTLGPQLGLTASNPDYASRVYSVFTDFGSPSGPGIESVPGVSGVQGNSLGELLISPPATTTTTTNLTVDQQAVATTPFRRFEDVAFDQYGYFSQGLPLTSTTTGTTTGFTFGAPVSAGSLFVADLATGLSVTVTPQAPLPTTPTINIPIQGPGTVGVTTDAAGNVIPIVTNGNTTGGTNIGGRIIRITPDGQVTTFAAGFHTSGAQDSSSIINSSLSITFSADGTTLYASDDDGIWQFKTTASLANSTSGSLIGLNDLRSLGVPYEGQDSAVAVIDSGVDANSTPFRGRVAPGINIVTNGFGNDDTSSSLNSAAGTTGGNTGGTTGGGGTVIQTGFDGHGTLVAGVVAQFVPQATIVPVNIFNPFVNFSGSQSGTGGGGTGGTNAGNLSFNTNAVTTTSNVYKGMKWVADHPFANDPIRPNKADRVIAATFGFGSQTTFDSEGVAYRQFPQIVISLKNQLRRYRKLGIAPIAAAGQFGNPLADAGGTTGGTGGGTTGGGGGGANNAQNSNVGDSNGMSLPAILNEVISVTGVIPFPYVGTPNSLPTDPAIGVTPRPQQPLLIGAGSTATTGGGTNTSGGSPLATLLLGNTQSAAAGGTGGGGGSATGVTTLFQNGIPQFLYSDRVLAAANRNVTTDYAAPAVDVPTFRRTLSNLVTTTSTTAGTTPTTDPNDHLTFTQGGTSLSAGIVTGAYALVSSALNYWTQLNNTGTTDDAYLAQPVGQHVLNFGPHPFKDVSAYNNPDGINSILSWTSVPVQDPNDGLSQSQPPYAIGTGTWRNFARIDVGNAIAAIEGEVAIQYLLDHNILPIIDTNNDSIITTTELQTFVDQSSQMGLPQAGAMARLLGGNARTPTTPSTSFGEQPDQPDVLQRRFNFFDYAADGQLNGSVTIDQLKMLAHTLLPKPDAGVVNDRQRASANGFLVDPNARRNFRDLQHIMPRYQFVPKGVLRKFRNITPDRFGVGRLVRGVNNPAQQYPVWTLFNEAGVRSNTPTATPAPTPTPSLAQVQTQPEVTPPVTSTGNTGNSNGNTNTATNNTGGNSITVGNPGGGNSITVSNNNPPSTGTNTGNNGNSNQNNANTPNSNTSDPSTAPQDLAKKIAGIITGS